MSHSNHAIVLINKLFYNMDVHHISREYAFSETSLTLLTSQQELSAFQSDFPAGTSAVHTGHNNRTTIVEERSYPQPPYLSLTLPQKRPNHSLISGRVGDLEESHPGVFTGVYPAKRLKGLITPPLPSPLSSCNSVVTTGLSQPSLDVSELNIVSLERADPAELTGDRLDSDRPKILRSPFEYTPELVNSQIDPIAEKDIQRFNPNRRVRSEKPSGYSYYAPTNPFDKTTQTLDTLRRVPRRQLSYGGDSPSKPGPRSLHKTTGSLELRHDAERHAEDYDLDSWSDTTFNASAARPYYSESTRSKARLWRSLSEEKANIQVAVSMQKLPETQNKIREYMLMICSTQLQSGQAHQSPR